MIEVVVETGSTNRELTSRIAAGVVLTEGDWLVADRQTAGRGRQGRVWSDGAGNFMGSTVVSLHAGDLPAHTLSLAAGVAVFAAVEAAAPDLRGLGLKWPNDLVVGQAKLAGILLERFDNSVVVGVGVNLVEAPSVAGRKTTSLAAFGARVERDRFAELLAGIWATTLELWRVGAWDQLRADWVARAHAIGTPLSIHGGDGTVLSGSFAGIDAEGALQLQLPGGTKRTVHAGEVMLGVGR